MKIFSNGTYREMTQQELAEYEALTALPSEQNSDYENRIVALESEVSTLKAQLETALDHIIELQNSLIGGEAE